MERYLADVREMAAGKKSRELIAFTLQNSFPYAATRIKFNGFGNSTGGSREMGEAFRWLENRMLLRLIYPSTSTTGPVECDRGKSPRLQMVDTGLVNYFSGIQKTLYLSRDMNAIFQGQVARQVAGQELISSDPKGPLHFWVRDKVQSTAEVDFLVSHENMVIPVEVKSGEPGRLRSLHQFMDAAPHPYAVRLHAGSLHIRQTETIRGKRYFLLSLPYFLAERINEHLRGFIRFAGN
jgi:predicted AAA+ superfamily ATPase